MKSTMWAMQVRSPRRFDKIKIPIPGLPAQGAEAIQVRTAWVSLCGSDIPFFTGTKRLQNYPLMPGAPIHECIGEVTASTCEEFHPGDQVLSIPDGKQGLAEYFIALPSRTLRLKTEAGHPGAACIIQPLSTVLNAADRLGDVRGQSIAVMGLGSIGLMFCWVLAQRGAAAVIGIDPLASRCRMAESLGATRTICRRGIELVHDIRLGAGWETPDICIEAVGHQMETLNDCLELVRKLGTVLAFGVPDHNVYALEFETFFRKNAILIATVTPEWTAYFSKSQDLFLANRETLSKFCTHLMPIREIQRAFEMYERHEDGIIKASIDAGEW